MIEKRGDVALLVVFHREPGPDAAQGIEECIGRFGFHLGNFAVGILFIQRLSLAKQGGCQMPVGVAIFSGNAVKVFRRSR